MRWDVRFQTQALSVGMFGVLLYDGQAHRFYALEQTLDGQRVPRIYAGDAIQPDQMPSQSLAPLPFGLPGALDSTLGLHLGRTDQRTFEIKAVFSTSFEPTPRDQGIGLVWQEGSPPTISAVGVIIRESPGGDAGWEPRLVTSTFAQN